MMLAVTDGILYFEGCNTVELAKTYGTPLYLVSEPGIVEELNELKKCFVAPYPGNRIAYAAKAFFPLAMAKLLEREDVCVDVVSGGELYTAMAAKFPPKQIEFNGNNKSRNEIEMAVSYGIGRIIIDSLQELALIEDVCKEQNKKMSVLFRITPGVQSDSHDYIVTGKKDSKFGIPLDKETLFPQIEKAIASPYVNLLGLHFHVGSQLFDNRSHLDALDILLDLVKTVKQVYDYEFTELNIGGGFGITYTDEKRKPFSYFLTPMMEKISAFYKKEEMPLPAVVVEPGRSIVGEHGITLYTVGSVKDISGVRKYVSVDGGMGDNIRPALYNAKYKAALANKAEHPATETVTISGKYCESGDILVKDAELPEAKPGDTLALFSTGAYGYSMANNYNKNPIPGVLLLNNGTAEWIVKPQTYEDVIQNECIPPSLR